MKISQEGISVTNRFFEAVAALRKRKVIRGLQTITRRYGMNRWNVVNVRNHPNRCVLKPEWIVYLVRDYGVSAEWLLLGKGDMFNEKTD